MLKILLLIGGISLAYPRPFASEWRRYTIDGTSRGADGVRVADVNGDRLPDLVTAWEEGGQIRIYRHPGLGRVQAPWPAVTVGQVSSPEDAVFIDANQDGHWDVLSACEGREKALYIHWAPTNPAHYFQAKQWTTQPIARGLAPQAWMFAMPLASVNDEPSLVIAGSKGAHATISHIQVPMFPRDHPDWPVSTLYRAGWIMSLRAVDLDRDGDLDVLASDRKGKGSGVLWLENPGPRARTDPSAWQVHRIGLDGEEVMFIDWGDLDPPGAEQQYPEIVAAIKPNHLVVLRSSSQGQHWRSTRKLTLPQNYGTAKAVRVGDLDLDGYPDLAFTCEGAEGSKSGVGWFRQSAPEDGPRDWQARDIGGAAGVKFDRIELLDLDGDGDLDLITCEERDNLGVIWYENPHIESRSHRE